MKIGIVGLGRVGLATALVLARTNKIVAIDKNDILVNKLVRGKIPFYEPGMVSLLDKYRGNIDFTTDYKKLILAKVIFITVQTPAINNKAYPPNLLGVISMIKLVNNNAIFVLKSTVPPGTASHISKKLNIRVVSNPEFLEEGNAINGMLRPKFIVIGASNLKDANLVKRLFSNTKKNIIITTNENAELSKYGINTFLASKIAFIEQFGKLCEKIPYSDIRVVSAIMSSDPRIGYSHLRPGLGFGGPCLEKDTTAILSYANMKKVNLEIIRSAAEFNKKRVTWFSRLIEAEFDGAKNRSVGILGISFKPDTDDIRNSKPLELAKRLVSNGFRVNIYDPLVKVNINGTKRYSNIYRCVRDSDLIVIANRIGNRVLLPKDKKVIDIVGAIKPQKDKRSK